MRDRAVQSARALIDESFVKQAAFIKDPAKFTAAICPRRAGKSEGGGRLLLFTAMTHPESHSVYIALTRRSAKNIMWDMLKRLCRDFKLGTTPDSFNETDLRITLPNGATIQLVGSDAGPADMERFLGQAYILAVIDEAASFRQSLETLVYAVLRPAMLDVGGRIVLIGTPGPLRRGLFYRVTTGNTNPEDAKFSVHRWSGLDNPYMADKIRADIEDIEANNPLFKDTPLYRMHYLGQWATDDDLQVYKFSEDRNLYFKLPEGKYSFVLGVDLGFNDATAFVVCAYSAVDKHLYVIEAFKRASLDFTATAAIIKRLQSQYGLEAVVVDGANKQGVEEMRKRHDLTMFAAEKTAKAEYILLANSDLIQGIIKMSPGTAPLQEEMALLVWDRKKIELSGKQIEHPDCENHCCDAFLYAWRFCYSYLAQALPPPPPKYGTTEWAKEEAERMWQAALDKAKSEEASKKRKDDLWGTPFPGGHDAYPS